MTTPEETAPERATTADARLARLLVELDLDERAALTAGVDMWHGAGVDRLGLVGLKVADGPAGVRGERFVGTTSACLPCGTALGATWNRPLLEQVGRVLGEEARTKAADIVLAPTVNLHRNALAGRNFECFSEDPLLSARAAVAVITGIQSTGVGACVKHLVANDSEFERHTISSDVDASTLRELYLLPFEAAVRDAGVVSVMSAYNRLNGVALRPGRLAAHRAAARRVGVRRDRHLGLVGNQGRCVRRGRPGSRDARPGQAPRRPKRRAGALR